MQWSLTVKNGWSESGRCRFVDSFSVGHQFFNSLTDFGLVGAKQVYFALDSVLVAGSHAGLGVFALAHQEGQIGIGTLHLLIVRTDE